jgi:hypothetical protein
MDIRVKIINNAYINDTPLKLIYNDYYWKIYYNEENITKHSKYTIKFICPTCNNNHSFNTTQLIRRINKCSINCYLCRNEGNNNNNKLSLLERKNESINEFNLLDDEFKNRYYMYHLTDNDYERIKKNIDSFHNGRLNNLNNYEYWSVFKMNNIFTSVIYDNLNNIIFKSHQPILKCDICNEKWRGKSIEMTKNCFKIICDNCKKLQISYTIKYYENIYKSKILYRTKIELKFIKWCNKHNILIESGPIILINNINYKISFTYNKLLIDIKGNKENINHNLTTIDNYLLITPKNWIKKISYILKINEEFKI